MSIYYVGVVSNCSQFIEVATETLLHFLEKFTMIDHVFLVHWLLLISIN